MKINAEVGVMCLQGKECQRLQANDQKLEEKHEKESPSQSSEEISPVDALIINFWPPEL